MWVRRRIRDSFRVIGYHSNGEIRCKLLSEQVLKQYDAKKILSPKLTYGTFNSAVGMSPDPSFVRERISTS
jgi:hypothetical protein